MRLLIGCHFSVVGFSNSYLIGFQDRETYGNSAICVDPGVMTVELLNLITHHKLEIAHVLITHSHKSHIQGLNTLCRVYPGVKIYSHKAIPNSKHPTYILDDGDTLKLSGIDVTAISVPGHSIDSMVYKIDDALFTGDTLMSGRIGSTNGSLEQALLLKSIYEKLYPLENHCPIFPGHGAPSTLGIERMFNPSTMVLNKLKNEIDDQTNLIP